MRRAPWALYLWPGLPQLCLYGSWAGLLVAIACAAILDLLLLGTFGWCELIGESFRTAVWATGGASWLIAVGLSAIWCRRYGRINGRSGNDLFGEAVNHYLRGDYFQAEILLERLLRADVRDLEARLMLATLMRHTGRFAEATQQLDTLVRFEGAAHWQMEVEQERDLLAEAKSAGAAESTEPAEDQQSKDVKAADAA
jgi:hypothetical protein